MIADVDTNGYGVINYSECIGVNNRSKLNNLLSINFSTHIVL